MSYDLSELLRRIGSRPTGGATVAPTARQLVDCTVELLDDPCPIDAEPLNLGGFVDGVQASSHLAYRGGRPIALQYVAAACVHQDHVVALREQLELVTSIADQEWIDTVRGDLPCHIVTGVGPHDVVTGQVTRMNHQRRHCELAVTDVAVEHHPDRHFLIDGSLTGWGADPHLVGVAKTVNRQWLADESSLWTLAVGWRSGTFVIPAGFECPQTRYSCYLRLFSPRGHHWDFALIRLETFDRNLIDPLAARCLAERQGSSRDARWDRHLAGVRNVEDILRSRRPALFG